MTPTEARRRCASRSWPAVALSPTQGDPSPPERIGATCGQCAQRPWTDPRRGLRDIVPARLPQPCV
eukprot:14434785-Alexandrium_andersonii.AAC.1